MKLSDAPVIELIQACAAQGRDTFFALRSPPGATELQALSQGLGERVLTLLPGAVYPCGQTGVTVLNAPEDLRKAPEHSVIFADVRLLGDECFQEYITRRRLRYVALPFYETAVLGEYGYKFSYRQLGELRAALPFPIHLIGVSADDRLEDAVFEALGTRDFAMLGEETIRKLYGAKTDTSREKFSLLARQCTVQPFKKYVILCATRDAAAHMHAFLRSCGIGSALFHGGRGRKANEAALQLYQNGKVNLLVATKSVIPSYPFVRADKLYYCGVPYSLSHADRCASLTDGGELICVWCEDDVKTLQTQTAGFMKALGITDPAFLQRRSEQLTEITALLND